MRMIEVARIEPGMRLGRTIYGSDGKVLLSAGVTLQSAYLKRLVELGYSSVYVADGIADDVVIPEVVRQETRNDATQMVAKLMEDVPRGKTPDLARVQSTVEQLLEEILRAKDLVVGMVDLKSLDNYTFTHSVNVAILCLMTARDMGYSRGQLLELGIGAVLHDIGKCMVPQEILLKPDKLTAEEYEQVKKHAEIGFDMLRKQFDVSLLAAHIAFQHHERLDGSGYPRRLTGDQIIEYARICAVADVFDACTSDRAYRKRLSPDQGIRVLQVEAGGKLDPRFVRKLSSYIVPFPLGTIVRLNTGDVALVISTNPDQLELPEVKIIRDVRGRSLGAAGPHVDLARMPEVAIAGLAKL